MKKISALLLTFLMLLGFSLWAGKTAYLTLKGVNEFGRGVLKNVSIDKLGRIALSPEIKEIFHNRDLLIYSMIKSGNFIYAGSGNNDTLYEISLEKKEFKPLFKGNGLAVNTVAVSEGTVYFSESPTNTIYKMDLKEKKAEKLAVFDKETYIWRMVFHKKKLYIVTGDNAKLYELDLNGNKKEIFANPKENHFLALCVYGDFVYFSGEGNGGVYQYHIQSGKTKTIYDAYEDEVNDLSVNEKGDLYFVTSSQTPKIPGTDFDYTDSFFVQATENERKAKDAMQNASGQKGGSNGSGSGKKMVVKNSLYVYKNSRVDKLFTRDAQVLYSVAEGKDGNVYVGSNGGQIYRYLMKENKLSIFSTLKEDQVLQLLPDKDKIFVGTGNLGRVFSMTYAYADKGEFLSRIINLGGESKIGTLTWEGDFPEKTGIRFYVRGGNSESVDKSWTDWTGPYTNPEGSLSALKFVRYIQYRVEFYTQDNFRSPVLDSIIQPFLAKNRKPSISSFRVTSSAADKKGNPYLMNINWAVYDSDMDKLTCQLFFKENKDQVWLPLTDKIYENVFNFDSRILPDGNYQFKLLVSDDLTNSPEDREQSEEISQSYLIDNHPPVIKILSMKTIGDFMRIEGTLEDEVSFVFGAYYSLNADEWVYLLPRDGIFDSKKETFEISLPVKELLKNKKENIIFIRAFDAKENLATAKFKIKE